MTTNSADLKFSYLTIREALKIASETTDKTRDGLVELIGEEMLDRLCRLGYITQGATIDFKEKRRIAVWKRTDQPNPYDVLDNKESKRKLSGVENLLHIM